MEYFIWFCLCYTLYRGYVLLGVLGGRVRAKCEERIPKGWDYIENAVQEEPAALPEVPCVDGEVW